MDWNGVRERNQQPTAALPERIETWWRMKGPSGKGLECAIYRHVSGVEAVPLPRGRLAAPQTAPQIGTTREIAEEWRQVDRAPLGYLVFAFFAENA